MTEGWEHIPEEVGDQEGPEHGEEAEIQRQRQGHQHQRTQQHPKQQPHCTHTHTHTHTHHGREPPRRLNLNGGGVVRVWRRL